jgi:phosphoribosyl-AMP cyclohydrolase
LEGTRVLNTVLEMKVVLRYPSGEVREVLEIRECDSDLMQLAIQEFSNRCIEEDFEKDCDADEAAFEIYHMKHTYAN